MTLHQLQYDSHLTRLVGVGEVRAEVVHHVQVAPLLDASANVPERLFGQLVHLLSVQAQFVSLVGPGDLPVDVRVVGRVVPRFRTVDEALDLIGRQEGAGKPQYGLFRLTHVYFIYILRASYGELWLQSEHERLDLRSKLSVYMDTKWVGPIMMCTYMRQVFNQGKSSSGHAALSHFPETEKDTALPLAVVNNYLT